MYCLAFIAGAVVGLASMAIAMEYAEREVKRYD